MSVFLAIKRTRDNDKTTGKIYQVVPRITDAIQEWIERVALIPVDGKDGPADVCGIELGGTIGPTIVEGLETNIFGKKVLCFVKFYLVDKNYTVVQLYTEEGIPASEAIEINSQDQSVLHMVEQSTKGKTEFFSPNAKAVLEEIDDVVEMKDESSNQPPHSKRTLMFGAIPTPIPATCSQKVIESTSVPQKADEVQSPIKKIKNQEENKEKEKAN